MKISAGLAVIYQNKILLVHPTNAPWIGSYGIPKGEIEDGENLIDAAIRETAEETGIYFDKADLLHTYANEIEYKSKTGQVYKKVYYFFIYLHEPIFEHQFKLQLEEVDWAGFLSYEEAETKITPRLKGILDYIRTNNS
jgi:ADP-ribose pyrophosphatase YjhB (NUDIX family)